MNVYKISPKDWKQNTVAQQNLEKKKDGCNPKASVQLIL